MKTLFRIDPVGVPPAADYTATTMVMVEGDVRARFLNRIAYQNGAVEVGVTMTGCEEFAIPVGGSIWKQGGEDVWSILEGMPEPTTEALSELFKTEADARGLPHVDAMELIHGDLDPADRKWVSAFILVWELVQRREDMQ